MPDVLSAIALMLFRPPRMPIGRAVRESIETFFLILAALIFAWIVTAFTHFK